MGLVGGSGSRGDGGAQPGLPGSGGEGPCVVHYHSRPENELDGSFNGEDGCPPAPHSTAVPKPCVRKGAGNKKKRVPPPWGEKQLGKKVEWTMCALIPLPPADDNEADRCCRETDKWTGR